MDATFADTSALYAVLDRDDAFHAEAAAGWRDLLEADRPLITHSYVLTEVVALAQRRLGPVAVRVVHDDVVPVLAVVWVDERLHSTGMTALLAAARADVSLADWISFEVMRARGISHAFAFDRHFEQQGFTLIPPAP